MAAGDDPVARADIAKRGHNGVARSLQAKTFAEIKRALDEAPRDPLVEKYRHLPPQDRQGAAVAEKHALQP